MERLLSQRCLQQKTIEMSFISVIQRADDTMKMIMEEQNVELAKGGIFGSVIVLKCFFKLKN